MKRMLLTLCALSLVGCGVYKEDLSVIVPPDATVHFTKLHGTDRQEKTGTKTETTDDARVFSKRVFIETEVSDLGRGVTNYDYIPSVWPVMTSRRPVFRSWTAWEHKGTSSQNQAFQFESLDSINFSAGAVIICRVAYEDTAKYRHKYAGKPLEVIVDKDVRNFFQMYMAGRFGKLDFREEDTDTQAQDCLNQCIAVYKDALEKAREYFAKDGITIDYFGNIGGLSPDNKETQLKLDRTYIQSMNVLVQQERNREQEVRNRMTVVKAEAERLAAEYRYEAKEAAKIRELFDAILTEQRAINAAAMKWGSVMANPEGEGFLGGGKGRLPSGMMPADSSPLAWLHGSDVTSTLAGVPTELDAELVNKARARLEEIERERKTKGTEATGAEAPAATGGAPGARPTGEATAPQPTTDAKTDKK